MTFRLTAVLILCGALSQAQEPEWIRLFVSNQRGGTPSLGAGDLRVSCGGRTEARPAVRSYQAPVSVAIVVQGSRDMVRNLQETQRALRSFLQHARAGDEFFTVKGLEQPALGTGFTSDVDTIVSSVAMPEGSKKPRLYDAMGFAVRYLDHARHPDRAIVVLSANEDVASTVQVKALMPRILAQRIPVYVASMYRRYADDLAPTFFELLRVAEQSGGDMWEVFRFNDLSSTLDRVDFHPQYLLGIPAALCSGEGAHQVKVEWAEGSVHQGLTLRYQRELISENAGLTSASRAQQGTGH